MSCYRRCWPRANQDFSIVREGSSFDERTAQTRRCRAAVFIARIQVDCDGLGLGNFLEFPHVEDDYSVRVAAATPEVLARDLVAPVVTGIARPTRPVSARIAPTRISATPSSATRAPITTPVKSTASVNARVANEVREDISVSGDGLRYFNGIGGYNDRTNTRSESLVNSSASTMGQRHRQSSGRTLHQ